MSMRDKVEELRRRRAEALRMGGEERLRRQRERGKLDARARLELLLDPGSLVEIVWKSPRISAGAAGLGSKES